MQKELAEFDEKTLNRQFERVWRDLLLDDKLQPSRSPKGYFIGGQPGAGKSSSISRIRSEHQGNVLEINVNDYRKFHPNFEAIEKAYGRDSPAYTNAFADALRDKVVERAVEKGYNVTIEGTLKSVGSAEMRLDQLAAKGYETFVVIQTCDPELSRKGIKDRYDSALARGETPRDVPIDFHDKVINVLPENADRLYKTGKMSKFEVYERVGNQSYLRFDSSVDKNMLPGKAIEQIHKGKSIEKTTNNAYEKAKKAMSVKKQSIDKALPKDKLKSKGPDISR
jgi:UDP-N-acetylglucosamine kinase